MLKICILGAGTASCIAIATMMYRKNKKDINFDLDLTCIHDPNIPIFPVGESMSPILHGVLRDSIGYDYDKNIPHEFDETLRWGSKNFWKKANNTDFVIKYENPGIHVNAAKLSPTLIKKFKDVDYFTEIHDNITEIVQNNDKVSVVGIKNTYNDFDFVIDCRGFPNNDTLNNGDYLSPNFVAINSVMLYQDFKKYSEDYTSLYVHENGWMFGIPLEHRKAFGYVYNDTITNEDDALQNFQENLKYYVGLSDISIDKIKKIKWRQFYKKEIIKGRIITMGNKLFFFDPQMGIPLHFTFTLMNDFLTIMNVKPDLIEDKFNFLYNKCITELQDLLAVNYAGENKIDSAFWKLKKKESTEHLSNSKSFFKWYRQSMFQDPGLWFGVPGFNIKFMLLYLNGYKINLHKMFQSKQFIK